MMVRPLLLAAVLAAPLPAQTVGGNAEAQAAATAFDMAQQQRDGAALERLLAPDFLFIRASGRVGDRRDFIGGFTAQGVTLEPIAITDRLFVRASPDVVVVGGDARLRGSENGRTFSQHYRYSDTLARRDGRWLVVFSQVTPLP